MKRFLIVTITVLNFFMIVMQYIGAVSNYNFTNIFLNVFLIPVILVQVWFMYVTLKKTFRK